MTDLMGELKGILGPVSVAGVEVYQILAQISPSEEHDRSVASGMASGKHVSTDSRVSAEVTMGAFPERRQRSSGE